MKRSRRQASRRPRAQKRTETKGSPLKKKRRRAEDDDLFLSQASVEVVWQCGEEVYEPISQGGLSQDLDVVMQTISSGGSLPKAEASDDSVFSLWKGRDQLSQGSTAGAFPTSQQQRLKGNPDENLQTCDGRGSKALDLMKNLMRLQKVETVEEETVETPMKEERSGKAPLQPTNATVKKCGRVTKRETAVVKEESSNVVVVTLDKENLCVGSADVAMAELQGADLMSEDDMKALQIAEELYHLQQLSDAFDFDESSCESFTATTMATTTTSATASSSSPCSPSSLSVVAAPKAQSEADLFAGEPSHSLLRYSTSTEGSLEEEMDLELIRVAELAELSRQPQTQADDSLSSATGPFSAPTNQFQRYTVVSVQRSSNHLVSLQLYNEQQSEQRIAQLSGEWTRTIVNSGDIVHVIGSFDMEKSVPDIHISDEENFLVLHPDILLSGTAIGSSFKCLRLAVLSHRCKWPLQMGNNSTSPLTPGVELREDLPPTRPPSTTPEMLYGEMVHLLFERSLVEGDFTDEFFRGQIEEIIAVNQLKLHSIGQEKTQATEKMAAYVASLQQWAREHLHVKHASSLPPRRGPPAPLCKQIHRVLAVEENIWSPRFGLQGKVDATVAVAVPRSNELQVAPLELKTGRVVSQYGQIPHRAQVALYTLMMSDRYSTPVQKGLLYYAKPPQNKMIDVFTPRNELKTLMLSRNEMAHYIHNSVSKAADRGMRGVPYGQGLLPPMLKDPRACGRCHQKANCFLYHTAAENGNSSSSGVESLWEETVGHVGEEEAAFFRKWERLIDLEAHDTHTVRQEIWTMTSAEREALGRCCGGLSLALEEEVSRCTPTPLSQTTEKGEELMTKKGFLYRFERRSATPHVIGRQNSGVFAPSQAAGVSRGSLLSLKMGKGDFVVISTEEGHICLGRGIVQSITERSMLVMMDERLQLPPDPLDPTSPRTLAPLMGDIEDLAADAHEVLERHLWRVDKDDMTSIFNTMKANIFRLLLGQDRHAVRLREIIVGLKEPVFAAPGSDGVLSDEQITRIVPEQLNGDQLSTIRTVLAAQDCTLVLGMPGTGKTTTISCLVKALVAMGKSVLVTAYTHSAVDNLLFKLEELSVPFLRLGRRESITPSLRKHCVNGSLNSLEELTTLVGTTQVVATTCLGVNDPLLGMKQFDYCIVDEASQLTLPVCLGPLFFAGRFVLVGDHHQLPPLVRNEQARTQGMDESLFKRLSDALPSAVVHLGVQYRMHADIMALSNHLTYSGRLRCGKANGGESLLLPSLHLLPRPKDHSSTPGKDWIRDALSPQCRVLFMDTDSVPCPEATVGNATQNPNEVKLVVQLCAALVTAGASPSSVGVVSPYRAQLDVISLALRKLSLRIDTNTVDKYQGKDKDTIILSLVRSNSSHEIGDLLRDCRRVNVALTRAKKKLLVVGSRSTIRRNDLFAKFLALVDEKGWAVRLPRAAHKAYPTLKPSRPRRR